MTEEQEKKVERKLLFIYIGILAVLIAFMILVGLKGMVDTIVYPIGISIFLAAYWVVSNVLSVIWRNGFEGKTADQKKSYYVCAALDGIGLAGLVHFLVNMTSTTGAIIYVACTVLKRKFREEFNGTSEKKDEKEAPEAALEEAEAIPEEAGGEAGANPEEDEEDSQDTSDTDETEKPQEK